MNFVIDPKSRYIGKVVLSCIILLMGLLLIFLPADGIVSFFLTICGVILILSNLPQCVYAWNAASKDKRYYIDAIASVISIVLGVLLILLPGLILNIIIAVWLIVMPLVRILLNQNPKVQLKKEIPYFLAAALLILFSFSGTLNVVVKIIGGCLILIALVYFVLSTMVYLKMKKSIEHVSDIGNQSRDRGNVIDAEIKEL